MKSGLFLVAAGTLALLLSIAATEVAKTQVPLATAASNAVSASGWPLRRAIHIDNTQNTNALSNYQVKVGLDGSNFDFDKAEPSGADVRFSDDDGTTLLYYWLQHYDAKARSAVAWVRVPNVPAASTKTIYLYYGNTIPNAISNGMRVFDFFDDFGEPGTGYYELSPPQTVLTVTQSWEKAAPHTLSVVEVNRAGYRYWGYYGLTNCGGIGLARSNDLLHWDKYAQNPLYGQGGERWPSVVAVDGTYYMVHDRDYCTTSYLVLRSSKDGLHFGADSDYQVLIPPEIGVHNQNANLFFDPKSRRFFLYWYHGVDNSGIWQIKMRSATTAEGLADPASEQTLIEEPYEIAAPQMLYYDNTYFLATEINENAWKTRIYAGSSPLGPFTDLPGNPILGDNEACFFQHVFSNTLHVYYCKDTGAGWVVNYRTADLSAGRSQRRILDVSKWSVPRGYWALVDAQGNRAASIVLSGTHNTETVLWSSAFTGTDYIVDVQGRVLSGMEWSLGVRAIDDKSMYRVQLRAAPNAGSHLSLVRWVNGSATPVAETALAGIDDAHWFSLTVKLHGPIIDVLVNGEPRLKATDAQFPAGRVALIGSANATVQFADVLVRKYAPQEPAITIASAETQQSTSGGWFGVAPTPALSPLAAQATAMATTTTNPVPASRAGTTDNLWLFVAAGVLVLLIGSVWFIVRRRSHPSIHTR